MEKTYYLTSGYSLQRWPEARRGERRLAIFGLRRYIGCLHYREEDLEKIIDALSLAVIEHVQDDEPEAGAGSGTGS